MNEYREFFNELRDKYDTDTTGRPEFEAAYAKKLEELYKAN
jgi:hypothetical protein